MLVFLAADEDRMAELDTAVRDYLGWSDVLAKQDELDLTLNQRNQALEKQKQANDTVTARLLGTYQWALVPEGQPVIINATKVEGQATSLAERVSKRLGSDGALTTQQAGAAIRHVLNTAAKPLWATGHVTVGDLWRLYAAYAYMPRLRDRAVLNAGLLNSPLLWEQDGFALADGYDDRGRAVPRAGAAVGPRSGAIAITDATLIVKPDRGPGAAGQGDGRDRAAPEGAVAVAPASRQARPGPTPGRAKPAGKTRFFGTKELSPTATPRTSRRSPTKSSPTWPPPRARPQGDHRDRSRQHGRLRREQSPHRLRERQDPEVRPVRLRRELISSSKQAGFEAGS